MKTHLRMKPYKPPGVVVFTGHMMDKAGRVPHHFLPRFPRDMSLAPGRRRCRCLPGGRAVAGLDFGKDVDAKDVFGEFAKETFGSGFRLGVAGRGRGGIS